jgi:pantoate--beta-alanine ligase
MVALSVCKDSNKISTDIPNNYIWGLTFYDKTVSLAVIEHISQIHSWVISQRNQGYTVGFVPTMGALHAGHGSLFAKAASECDRVVASIFVNPTQFNNSEDLDKYPRTPVEDRKLLEDYGCHALFCPDISEMYASGQQTEHWDFGPLTSTLEGHYRPGHFDGVLTIVKKLFLAVHPDKAFFGEKDFQQLALIRRMTQTEGLPIEIVSAPTIRESSGLALSSRNVRLSETDRETAIQISRVLLNAQRMGRSLPPKELEALSVRELSSIEALELEYCSLVVASDFSSADEWSGEKTVLLVAAYVGGVRLIDNVIID